MWRTDGWTDGQNYDSLDRASIAASRGKNHFFYSAYKCWIQISMVDVINIAANRQKFMTLIGELSWQRLRQSAIPAERSAVFCYRRYPRDDQSTSCLVRDLTSLRAVQSATCPVRETTSPQVGNTRVGASASCPVTNCCHCKFKIFVRDSIISVNFLPHIIQNL